MVGYIGDQKNDDWLVRTSGAVSDSMYEAL